jgi:hypothetical protein
MQLHAQCIFEFRINAGWHMGHGTNSARESPRSFALAILILALASMSLWLATDGGSRFWSSAACGESCHELRVWCNCTAYSRCVMTHMLARWWYAGCELWLVDQVRSSVLCMCWRTHVYVCSADAYASLLLLQLKAAPCSAAQHLH